MSNYIPLLTGAGAIFGYVMAINDRQRCEEYNFKWQESYRQRFGKGLGFEPNPCPDKGMIIASTLVGAFGGASLGNLIKIIKAVK